MSVDMNSQASDSNEEDFGVNSEEEDEDDGGEEDDQIDIASYYEGVASDVEQQGADSFDPEEYQFTCLTYKESQRVLTEEVNTVAAALKVSLCQGWVMLLCWVGLGDVMILRMKLKLLLGKNGVLIKCVFMVR